jgi:hypothetical protein
MDLPDDPAVAHHINVFIVVCVIVVIAGVLRCYLLCRPHSDTISYPPRAADTPWLLWATQRALKFLWASQVVLTFVLIAALATTAVMVGNLDSLFEAIRETVNYPNEVVTDLQSFTPAGTTATFCESILANAINNATTYEVPDFREIDSFVSLMWVGIGLWASMVGFYVTADRIEVGAIQCIKNATGQEPCATLGTRARRLFCIGGIAGCFMWLCTFVFVGALVAARTAIVVGCDYVDVPEEAEYLFYTDSTQDHPFLETLKDALQTCGAPPRVLQHLNPGALSPQLATLYNVCDNLEDQLMALVVLGTFIFPITVLAAWWRQKNATEEIAANFEFLL